MNAFMHTIEFCHLKYL